MPDTPQVDTSSGSQLVGILRRYPWSSLVIVLAAVALALIYATQFQGGATATARLSLTDPRANTVLRQGVTTEAAFLRYAAQRAEVAESTAVLEAAATALRAEGITVQADELPSRIDAASNELGDVRVTARGSTVEESVTMANAVVEAYREVSRAQHAADEEVARAAIEETRELIAGRGGSSRSGTPEAQATAEALARLEVRLTDVVIDATTFDDGVRLVDPAVGTAAEAGAPAPVATGLAGLLFGLVLAVAIGFVRSEPLIGGRHRRVGTAPGPGE